MPYELAPKHPGCPTSKPFGVINQDTRRLEGCSATEADAKKHLAALYANTSDTEQRADASTRPWSDFPESKYTPEQYARACLIDTGAGSGKDRYSLPVREPDGTLNRNGVHAAAARLGQVQVSPDKKAAAARSLLRLYSQIGDEAPESVKCIAGEGASQRADDDTVIRGVVEERSATLAGVDWPSRVISVIAVPYEQETPVEYRGEIWHEVFSRAAFNGIDTRQRRIPASAKLTYPSFDHQDAKLVGKVVGADPTHPEGLLCDVKISKIPAGDETLQLAEDRALSPSVGFLARGGDHVLNRSSMTRRINRAFLDHLSFVPQPAYDGARIVAVRAEPEAAVRQLTPLNTPTLDAFLNDDVIKWANEQRLGD